MWKEGGKAMRRSVEGGRKGDEEECGRREERR